MKKNIVWIVVALALVALIVAATLIYNSYEPPQEEKPSNIVLVGKGDKDKNNKPETDVSSDGNNDSASATENEDSSAEMSETSTENNTSDTLPSGESSTEKEQHSEADTHEHTNETEVDHETESVVESEPESESASATEKVTEKVTEKITEKETEKVTERVTEKETEEETVSPYLAPDITVYEKNGRARKLSEFRGKPIVLNFWSSGCGPCRTEMPHFQEAYEKYGDEVEFLIVNCIGFFGDTVASASSYIESEGYTFPVYYDVNNEAVGTYIGYSVPYTFFIDRDFDLYVYIPGMASAADIDSCIQMILE